MGHEFVGNFVANQSKSRRVKSPMREPHPIADPRELFDFDEMYVSAHDGDFSSRTVKLRLESSMGSERWSRNHHPAFKIQ